MNKTITHIFIFLLVLLASATAFAQQKVVLGKIIAKTRDLEGIYVKNKNNNQSTSTEKGGYFSIEASPNDTLIFSGGNLIGRQKALSYADMNKALVFVPMEYMEDNMMDELIIDRRVTTESLGLGGARKYTPAERRLHTATSSGGGIIPIDAIVNAISGRTKMLKKALALEREYDMVNKILDRFPDEFYTDNLKIPEEYRTAFGYFMAQDPVIVNSFQNSDVTQQSMMYTEKATEFLEIVNVLK